MLLIALAKDKYVIPVLTLLPTKKATLTLKVEIEGSDAKKIEYKYDKTYFKLDKTEVSHKTVGKKELADDLTIECIKEFSKDQFIEVEADGKFAGKLKVIANGKAHRYKADIVFVEVTTKLGNKKRIGTSIGRKKILKKYLNQALVEPEFDVFSPLNLDLSSDAKFNTIYATGINTDIQDYLNTTLYNQYDKQKDYRGHYKVYFVDEVKGYGVAYGVGATVHSVIVYRDGLKDTTVAHETLHAMGLWHSFSTKGEFTFEKYKTDSIMDYSDIAPTNKLPVISTWQWQWKILWNNLK